MAVQASEVLELVLMAAGLLLLVWVSNFLAESGAFNTISAAKSRMRPLLVAVCRVEGQRPGLCPMMHELSTLVESRGVVEEGECIMGLEDTAVTRGEFFGAYLDRVGPRMGRSGYAYVGVVLESGGERANAKSQEEWSHRLAAKRPGIQVELLPSGECVRAPFTHAGYWSETVASWRVYRKIARVMDRELKGRPQSVPGLFETISLQRKRVLTVAPLGNSLAMLQTQPKED